MVNGAVTRSKAIRLDIISAFKRMSAVWTLYIHSWNNWCRKCPVIESGSLKTVRRKNRSIEAILKENILPLDAGSFQKLKEVSRLEF